MFAIIILLAVSVTAENIVYPESSKLVFHAPNSLNRKDLLFGFSIAYLPHDDTIPDKDRKSLIISAPKAGPVGKIFQCDFETTNCTELEMKLRNSNEIEASHLWLGASVRAGKSFFVTCAPRSTSYNFHSSESATFEKCYYFDSLTKNLRPAARLSNEKNHWDILSHYDPIGDPVRWNEYSPVLMKNYKRGYSKNRQFPQHFQMDSFGWSIEVPNDGTVLIGGPAMMIGRVMVYRHGLASEPDLISVNNTEFSKSDGKVDYNFGYSITSGKFYKDELAYAVSTPYGEIGKGKILFFDTDLKYINATIVDDDVGSVFGASLCTANEGSLLLVGAPAWSHSGSDSPSIDFGAVHLYVAQGNNRDKLSWKRVRTISEFKQYSYFGSEIVNLGDLDGDGKDEIAVAAPFENDGQGAVYIYSGADLLKNTKQQQIVPIMQKIEGAPFDTKNQNLGLGIAVLEDYDENGCNELAIGVPGNNKVVVLRCMATVTIKLGIENYPAVKEMIKDIEDIQFNQCLYVEYNEKPRVIQTEIIVKAKTSDNVRIASGVNTFVARLTERKQKFCSPIRILLFKDGDYDKSIEFNMTAEVWNPPKAFQADSVKFSDRSVNTFSTNFNVSGSSLILSSKISITQGYLIGSTRLEQIKAEVLNNGRFSKHWCLKVHIDGVKIKDTTDECKVRGLGLGDIVCSGTPIKTLSKSSNEIHLDTASMTSLSRYVNVELNLYKICEEPSTLVKSENLSISLITDNNVKVIGISLPSHLNVTKSDLSSETVYHRYEIINYGITHWKGMKYSISFPPNVIVKLTGAGDCEVVETIAMCTLDDLLRNSSTTMGVAMTIAQGITIRKFSGSKISTQLKLTVAESEKRVSVDTPITSFERTVPIWVIIAASIVGLLILIIIAFILKECGWLRRKNKENLEKLKQEVKRQSQIRRSMRIRDSVIISEPGSDNDTQRLFDITEGDEGGATDVSACSQQANHQKYRHNPKNRVLPDIPVFPAN